MTFLPIGERILIQELPENKEGMFVIPEEAKKSGIKKGVVVSVTPSEFHKDGKSFYKEGDIIIFGVHAFAEIKLDNKVYYVGRETDSFGKLENEKN